MVRNYTFLTSQHIIFMAYDVRIIYVVLFWILLSVILMQRNLLIFIGCLHLSNSLHARPCVWCYKTTRKSSCVNARGIPPARGRKMLTPLPPPAGPDPPPPPLDLTPPVKLDLTPPPPAGWTWHPPPPSAGPDPPPPRCGLTNKVKLLPSRRTTYAGGN